MKNIKSFVVDHTKLQPGLYVSRVDYINNGPVTTYDLRMKKPNSQDFIPPAAAHTLEHLLATVLRNADQENCPKIIYVGPMGCLTGFYVIIEGEMDVPAFGEYLARAFYLIRDWNDPIPGATAEQCGNFRFQDIEGAKKVASDYLEVLLNLREDNTNYTLLNEESV